MNFRQAESVLSEVAKQSVAIYGLSAVGVSDMVNRDHNSLTRSLKRGFSWYVANELVEEVSTMDSNFHHMDSPEGWLKAVDDTVYFGLVGYGIEKTGVYEPIYNSVEGVVNAKGVAESVATGTLLVAGKRLGNYVQSKIPYVRNLASHMF